ncbi:MAG TPA: FecR domain-containing protein [Cytophagaceae bacterium]|nr:FecR domain-containing protein [Cytophagaceae bacterium]
MEKHYENDDTLLARWLSGELSEEEKKALEASGDLPLLEKIAGNTSRWSLPELKQNYAQLQQKLENHKKEAKVIPLYQSKLVLRIAASVLLLVGIFSVYQLFFSADMVTYQCEAGQKMEIFLPDRTLVKLNGQSSISFDNNSWNKERKVALEGEAYFEVYQKGPFAVLFPQGEVNVLGTKFNVFSGADLAIVKCYEGKVSVENSVDSKEILTAGQAVKVYTDSSSAKYLIADKTPDWLSGESTFADAPLIEVINALSVQFNTQFEITDERELSRKFSGKFIHTDLETALSMVFPPMSIPYSIEGDKRKTVVLK